MKTHAMTNPYQNTLSRAFSCRGIGLHSGRLANMTINPAAANSGIRFVRTDLPDSGSLPAFMNRVTDTRLATTIAEGDITVATTEHLLAALTGMGVDNAIVALDSAEVPIMDGSSAPFAELIQAAGIRQQRSYRRLVKITRKISFQAGDRNIHIQPYDGFKITAEIDFNHDLIKGQLFSIEPERGNFRQEIAAARTFGFIDEVQKLQENGLAMGASLDNAVGLDHSGVLNRDGLRYKNEFVRHKILDIIGDLTLLGCPLLGHVIAYKSGHSQHIALLKAIAATPDAWEFVELNKNGQLSILDKVVSTTRTASQRLLPFLIPQPQAVHS